MSSKLLINATNILQNIGRNFGTRGSHDVFDSWPCSLTCYCDVRMYGHLFSWFRLIKRTVRGLTGSSLPFFCFARCDGCDGYDGYRMEPRFHFVRSTKDEKRRTIIQREQMCSSFRIIAIARHSKFTCTRQPAMWTFIFFLLCPFLALRMFINNLVWCTKAEWMKFHSSTKRQIYI